MSDKQFTANLNIPAGRDNPTSPDIAWRPTPVYLERSRLRAFMERHDFATFEDLLNKAAQAPEWFWGAAVQDLGLEFYTPFEKVMDISRGWEWATWFTGSQYNYVHDALDKRASGADRHRSG